MSWIVSGLGDDVADGLARVERRVRVLEDHRHLAPLPAEVLSAEGREILAPKRDAARGRLVEAEQGAPERRLPAAGLADQPDRPARADGEVDPVDRVDVGGDPLRDAAADGEVLHEACGLDQEVVGGDRCRRGAHSSSPPPSVNQHAAEPDVVLRLQGRLVGRAAREPERAPGMERAPGRLGGRVRRRALDRAERVLPGPVELGLGLQQPPGVRVARAHEHLLGRTRLDNLARVHHDHPVADARDDAEVVGDEHGRRAGTRA